MTKLIFRVISSITILICIISQLLSQEQRIKPGDALSIIVYGQEELNQTVVVSPEGNVDYPAMQGIPVDELTLQQVQDILRAICRNIWLSLLW